jgi:hypothetical protein
MSKGRAKVITAFTSLLLACLLVSNVITGCTASNSIITNTPAMIASVTPTDKSPADACPVTEAVWAKPPEDPAVLDPPAFGYYYVNEDRSMWASAWWVGAEERPLRVSEEGVKVGWFRPAGATLDITGWRLDGKAPPLEAHASCCYPTRFQASGLYFPTEGCWEISARAAESELSFIVWVEP